MIDFISAMFCSKTCHETSMKECHQLTCQERIDMDEFPLLPLLFKFFNTFDYNFKEMKTFLKQNDKPVNVFNYDFSNRDDPVYHKNMMHVMTSVTTYSMYKEDAKIRAPEYVALFKKFPKWRKIWKQHEHFLFQLLVKLMPAMIAISDSSHFVTQSVNTPAMNPQECLRNSMLAKTAIWKQELIGIGFYPVKNLFRSSCYPNVQLISANNQKAYVVTKPTLAGSEVFCDGMNNFYDAELLFRQEMNQELFGSKCNCDACTNKWPKLDDLEAIDPNFISPRFIDIRALALSSKAKVIVIENIKKSIAYIEANYKPGKPTKEVCTCIRFIFWMHLLAQSPVYP